MFYRKTIPLWLIIWVGLVMPYGVLAAGNVTGTVMDIGNNPLPNISAIASQWNCNGWYQKSTATTDATGHYNLNLAEGVYRVTFHDNTGTYAEHKTTEMTVTDGSTTSGINAQLVLGGDIAGTVTNASSTPVENIKVTVYVLNDNSWDWLDSTSTDNVGYYKFTALKPGTYHLRFSDNNWPKFYQEEYYNNAATLDAGTDVQITAGNTTSISNVLNEGGHIIGTVIDENNQPLEGINVEAYYLWNGDYWGWQAYSHTDSNGQYDLKGLSSDEYALKFSSSTHITEYYTDAFDRDNATKIAVLAGKTTTNINAQLAPGGFISGTVTDINANLLQNIRVKVYDINGHWQNSTYTDSDGNYTLGGLNTSSYKLLFEQPDWDNVVYAPKTVTEIQVTVGQTTSGINVQLGAAGHITGIVTDKDNKPLSEVQVTAFQQQGNVWSHIQDTRTDDMGYYVLTGLGTGNYQVEFSCYNSDLPSEYYNDTLNISDATDISVTAGNATTDINAQLAVVGGSIISTVPAIPSNLNTTIVSQTEMTLNWTDNSDNETGFKIFRNGTELTPSPKVVANVTSFNDTGLTCATAYTYEVKATNANGDSAAISANATTQACPLPVVFHSLTIQTPGTGKGSIEGTEAGSHAEGTLVTVTAVAETGSEFKAWTPAICEKTFILTSDFTCTAEFTLKPQVPEVDLVTSDFCKLNPDYSECQVVNACKENPNDCITGFKLIDSTIPTVAIANSLDLSQPSISPVIDIVGLKASFAAHGDNLSDGTNITVEDCENMQLLPGGNLEKREFFCTQWGLPGIKKGVVKDQNGAELYDFEVDARYDCKAVTEIPVAECETLSKLYNETNGKDWKNAATNKWLIDITPCGWDGITCANGHVTQLLLADNNLSGSLPDLCPLTELEELDLSNNAIEGEIPSCLSKLKFANLFGTQVQSVIANICKWNPTLSWCKETSPLQSVVTACQQTANSPICGAKIKFIPSVGAVIVTEPNQPIVTDYVGLPVSFTAIGSELNIDTGMTVEDCSDVLLLPNGTITKREFYCMQWGLPGLKKGAFKKAGGHLLYEFDVDTKYICEAVTEIPIEECQTLLTLYNSTQGQEWKNASTNKWLRDIKPCGWSGITCGNGRITKIDLEENQLSGSIPDLSALTDLKRLDLRNNQLSGSIPDLSALTNLEWLWLSYNQLSGSIPNLSMLTNLELLGLSYNQLSGSIPDLSHASNTLTALYLTNNQLCGEITPSLASLVHISDPDSSTKFFSISDNHLWTNDSTLIAFLNKKEPNWANTQTQAEGCGVPTTPSSTPIVSHGGGTPSMPSVHNNGSINGSYNNGGGTVTEDFTVEPGSSISNLVIEGKVTNHGTMSNVTIEECAELIGGKLSGYITNHGLVHDFEFVGATLTGGMLSGHIYNKSKVGGRFIDVTLLADTVIEGGILEGKIQGDCEAPALLKNLTVKKGSHLSCVTIDDSVILKDDVVKEPVWEEYETGEVLELGCGKTITIPKETGDSVVLEDDVIVVETGEEDKISFSMDCGEVIISGEIVTTLNDGYQQANIGNLTIYARSIKPDTDNNKVFIAKGDVTLEKAGSDSDILGVDTNLKIDYRNNTVETIDAGEITANKIKRNSDSQPENISIYHGGFSISDISCEPPLLAPPVLEMNAGGQSTLNILSPEDYPFEIAPPGTITLNDQDVIIADVVANFSKIFSEGSLISLPEIKLSQTGESSQQIKFSTKDLFKLLNRMDGLTELEFTVDLMQGTTEAKGEFVFPIIEGGFSVTLGFFRSLLNKVGFTLISDFFAIPPKAIPVGILFDELGLDLENFSNDLPLKLTGIAKFKLADGAKIIEKFEEKLRYKVLSGEGKLAVEHSTGKTELSLEKVQLLEKLHLANGKISYDPASGLSIEGQADLVFIDANLRLKVSHLPSLIDISGKGTLNGKIPGFCADLYFKFCVSETKVEAIENTFSSQFNSEEIKFIQLGFKLFSFGIKAELTDSWHFYVRGLGSEFQIRRGLRQHAPVIVEVKEPHDSVLFHVVSKTGQPSVILQFPDGRIYTPSTTPSLTQAMEENGEIAYFHNESTHEASYAVKNPPQGNYVLEVANLSETGEYEVEMLHSLKKPTIDLVSLNYDQIWDAISPINITWESSEPNGEAKVSLFYDDDDTDTNGSLIAVDILASTGQYEWTVPDHMQTGNYYIYAKIDDDQTLPVYAYSTGRITINRVEAPTQPNGVVLEAGDGTIDVIWQQNPETNIVSYRVHVSDSVGDDNFEHNIGVDLQTNYTIKGLTNGKTYEIAVSAINDKLLTSLLSVPQQQTPQGQTEGNGIAIDSNGNFVGKTRSKFQGGITVNNEAELPQVMQTTTDEVLIGGQITADFTHIGDVVDLLVVGIYEPTSTAKAFYMLEEPDVPIEQQAITSPTVQQWDGNIDTLVPMKKNIILQPSQHIDIWKGQLGVTGELQIYYGYRLKDGTIVYDPEPIQSVISD